MRKKYNLKKIVSLVFAVYVFSSHLVVGQYGLENKVLREKYNYGSTQNGYGPTTITYPLEGSVIQRTASGNTSFSVTGKVKAQLLTYYNFAIVFTPVRLTDSYPTGASATQYNLSFPSTQVAGNVALFNRIVSLPAGWYYLSLQAIHKVNGSVMPTSAIHVGVGDVFLITGQSNARGVPQTNHMDPTLVSYHTNGQSTIPDGIRVLNAGKPTWWAESEIFNRGSFDNNLLKRIHLNNGMPHFKKFNKLDSITNVYKNNTVDLGGGVIQSANLGAYEQLIYPFGGASWAYIPFGKKYIQMKNVPVQFFNFAVNDMSVQHWQKTDTEGVTSTSPTTGVTYIYNNRYKNFIDFVNFQGKIMGFRGVLWYQGERDIYDNTTQTDYQNRLSTLITNIKNDFSGGQINWFISKMLYGVIPPGFTPTKSGTYRTQIKSAQTSVIGLGVPGARVFDGVDDSVSGLADSASRAVGGNIHFTGSHLTTLGEAWYTAVDNNLSNATPVVGQTDLKNITITYNSSTGKYTLTPPPGYTEYYWVKNENPITPSDRIYGSGAKEVGGYGTDREYWTCYMKVGTFYEMTVPFVVPNSMDDNDSFSLPTNLSFASSETCKPMVIGGNTFWTIREINYPSGTTPFLSSAIMSGNGPVTIQVCAAVFASTGTRSGKIVVDYVTSSGLVNTKEVNVIQSGSGGCSGTSLTSLTPTNSSSEWSGYGSARFNGKSVDNNTMQVSGVQYSQGIGTHSNSRIVYNLGGAYTTFTGLVGRDDEADNNWDGGKVVFSIKTDGSTVWTSTVHGNTSSAQSFSIPVSGKNTLELIVDKYTDENYSDHANWMNVNLTCSGGCTNAAPTGVSASPSSFSSGGGTSNLTATCAAGTTVVWNGSVGSGSPKTVTTTSTTTYTAKCVSTSCSDSPTVSVTVNVDSTPPATGCSAITNNLVMGYWTVTGHDLVVKQFHGQWWLVQRISTSPETFLVRGSNMLTRGDVYLHNSTYAGLTGCFGWRDSDFGGLEVPSSGDFATPSGYTLAYEPDGTPYYTASGTPPIGCTNAYLTNSWTYASAAGGTSTVPVIGIAISGGNMAMGSTNYTSSYPGTGIGTHATSEIIYDLGAAHTYQYFKSTVGKDNGSNCGGHDRLKFKVVNNATGAVLGESPIVGNSDFGLSRTADLSIPISGVRYLKLVVEDGGDGISCDHANWARARLTCTSSGRVSARDSLAPLFTIYPNISNGEFTVEVDLDTDSDFKVDLINSSGAVYKQESHSGKKGQNPVQFKAGNVKSGLYLLRVTTRDRLETKTVVIEK